MMEWTMPIWVAFSCLTGGGVDPICFEFPGEVLVQSDVILGIRGILRVGESIQEVVRCNHPPCLRNRLLPKPFGLAACRLGGSRCKGWMDIGNQD